MQLKISNNHLSLKIVLADKFRYYDVLLNSDLDLYRQKDLGKAQLSKPLSVYSPR